MPEHVNTIDDRHPLARDIKAFESQKSELERTYFNKFVVFFEGEFVGSFDSFNNAATWAVTQYGRGPFLIRRVGAPETIPLPASVAFRPIYATN